MNGQWTGLPSGSGLPLPDEGSAGGRFPMKKFVLVLLSLMTLGLCASASPRQAAVIRACQVKDAPTNCENMWAIVAHVTLSSNRR